jgi:hypothetical protein
MIKMKKTVSLISLVAILFFTGCGDEEDPTAIGCRITSFTGLEEEDDRADLTYSSDGKLLTFSYSEGPGSASTIFTATYSGANLVKLALPQDVAKTEFSYDNSGRIIRVDNYFGDEIDRTEFTFNSSGQLVRIDFSDKEGIQPFVDSGYEVYEYATTTSQNPVSSTDYGYDGDVVFEYGTHVYEYDNKNSFYKDTPFFGAIFGFVGENNVLKDTYTNDGGSTFISTFTYQYNDQGYPISGTAKFDDDPADQFTLTYDCD